MIVVKRFGGIEDLLVRSLFNGVVEPAIALPGRHDNWLL
jgi:hypothetical protein